MSPAKLERCVKEIRKKIKQKKIPKHYIKKGKKYKTSAWAICKSTIKKKRKNNGKKKPRNI